MKKFLNWLWYGFDYTDEAEIICKDIAATTYIYKQAPWHGEGLDVGVLTNKGIIKKIIYDIHPRFNTDSGSYMADELKIIVYNG